MSKRLFWLLTTLIAMALLVAACGGADSGSTVQEAVDEVQEEVEEASEQVEQAVEEAQEAVEEAVEEVTAGCTDPLGCVTVEAGDALKIASALVISGPDEQLGIDSQRGVEIAIDSRGEVVGHSVQLVAEDDGCSAEGGQTAATKIASDESIVAVVGHSCSSSCTPAAPIYNDAGVTMVSPLMHCACSNRGWYTRRQLAAHRPQRQHPRSGDGRVCLQRVGA